MPTVPALFALFGERDIKLTKKINKITASLRTKALLWTVFAIIVGCGIFFLTQQLGNAALWKYYMSDENVQKRENKYIKSFEQYVKENDIVSTDTEKIMSWLYDNSYIYLMMYKDEKLIFENGWTEEGGNHMQIDQKPTPTVYPTPSPSPTAHPSASPSGIEEEDGIIAGTQVPSSTEEASSATFTPSPTEEPLQTPEVSDELENAETPLPPVEDNSDDNSSRASDTNLEYLAKNFYSISFADGNIAVSIVDFTKNFITNIITVSGLFLAFLAFAVITLLYNHHITKRVIRLSGEVVHIGSGDLESHVTCKGNDEIALLADNVDKMRNSIISRLQSEQNAWAANYELITSMSHDIRTPLTTLIGYLEMLESSNNLTEEQYKKYITISKNRAFQLKDMSDRLFQYFLVFGNPNLELQLTETDASILLQQIIYEHTAALENDGYTVNVEMFQESAYFSVDINHLQRLFDNIFSNIKKYGDKNKPVRIICAIENDSVRICVRNYTSTNSQKVASTRIGLQTCAKIVEQLEGNFEYITSQETFTVNITLPLLKGKKTK